MYHTTDEQDPIFRETEYENNEVYPSKLPCILIILALVNIILVPICCAFILFNAMENKTGHCFLENCLISPVKHENQMKVTATLSIVHNGNIYIRNDQSADFDKSVALSFCNTHNRTRCHYYKSDISSTLSFGKNRICDILNVCSFLYLMIMCLILLGIQGIYC